MGHTWGQQHMHAFEYAGGSTLFKAHCMLTKSQSSIMPPARLLPADVIWERYYMRDEVGPAPRAPFDPTRGFLVGGYTSNPQPCWLGSSGQGLQRSAAQPCVLGPISPGQALQRSATLQWLLWPWREISCLHIFSWLYEPWPSPAELSCLAMRAWLN